MIKIIYLAQGMASAVKGEIPVYQTASALRPLTLCYIEAHVQTSHGQCKPVHISAMMMIVSEENEEH